MDINVWCIIASLLIVSAGALRFDQGPQKFSDSSSQSPQREQRYENREVVLYLTPRQIKALEAGGAVVRSADTDDDQELASETPQANEEQSEESTDGEQEPEESEAEPEQPEQEEEAEQPEQPEQESVEDEQDQDFDLEEIFKILNEEKIMEEEAKAEQARNEPQVEEENTEEPREIPPRFQLRPKQQQQQQQQQQPQQQQREEKYIAPAAKKANKIYAAIRYQPNNEQSQKIKVQVSRLQPQPQQPIETEEQQEQGPQTGAPEKRYRLVPYEVEEQAEESAEEQTEAPKSEQEQTEEKLNELLAPLISPDKLVEAIDQRKSSLFQNELEVQAILEQLKQSPKHNDQKYAIEIEKLRANLEKQNALAKAQAIAKYAPQLIKKEISKRRPNQAAKQAAKQATPAAPERNLESQRSKASRPLSVPVEISRPVPVPKTQRVEAEKAAPAESETRTPTRNVYVKVNKPYLVERIVPVTLRRNSPEEIPNRKQEKVTILRHIWD